MAASSENSGTHSFQILCFCPRGQGSQGHRLWNNPGATIVTLDLTQVTSSEPQTRITVLHALTVSEVSMTASLFA